MSRVHSNEVLNRLLSTQRFSLADYLHWARPWTNFANDRKWEVVCQIVKDHEDDAYRVAHAIEQGGGTIEGGGFPMRFSSLNDLALDFLTLKLIDAQRQTITEIESCVAELQEDLAARSLAEELLGAAKGHLENLLEASGRRSDESGGRHTLTAVA